MPVYKDKKRNTWFASVRYTDWTGETRQTTRRGFKLKRDAQEWEREFKLKTSSDPDMTFESFVELYEKDIKPRLKLNTWKTKDNIIKTKILPYFKNRTLSTITVHDVIEWQNKIRSLKNRNGEPYSEDYLKTIHAQLSSIFNHAVRFYGLQKNPAALAGSMGSEQGKEMLFWTKEEYLKFIDVMMDEPDLYYAFELLYWCGIREGELLALTPADFDFEHKMLRINKSYQRLDGEDVITSPKTPKSNRIIQMPDFLCDEIHDFIGQLYEIEAEDRMFLFTKHRLKKAMERGSRKAGVKQIRIHDLRHSHVSLLINMGYSALAIGERIGHESEKITYRYAHLFPSVQTEMAEKLNMERGA